MLLIALTPAYTDGGTISTKMAGVVLASLSGGAGEMSFLSLTHFYGPFSLASWGSGTGAAGLIGAGAYALATTSLGLDSKKTIFASSFLPIIMLLTFFVILPNRPASRQASIKIRHPEPRVMAVDEDDDALDQNEFEEDEGLLSQSQHSRAPYPYNSTNQNNWQATLLQNIRRSRSLFFP